MEQLTKLSELHLAQNFLLQYLFLHRDVGVENVREEKTNDLRMLDGVHAAGMVDTTERREQRVAKRHGGAP